MSNLKQIGLAVAQYEGDYDEVVPCGHKATGGGAGWAGQIYPYTKANALYICPNDTTQNVEISYAYNGNLVSTANSVPVPVSLSQLIMPSKTILLCEVVNFGIGYGPCTPSVEMAQMLHGSPAGNGGGSDYDPNGYGGGVTDTAAAANVASKTAFLQYATGITRLQYSTSVSNGYPAFNAQFGRHLQGACYLFSDNHAKWLLPSQVTGGAENTNNSTTCGYANYGWAAMVSCGDPTIAGTWNYQ